jgi:hypothetical protein
MGSVPSNDAVNGGIRRLARALAGTAKRTYYKLRKQIGRKTFLKILYILHIRCELQRNVSTK